MASPDSAAQFIHRWSSAQAAERALSTAEPTKQFTRAKESEVAAILATLIAFGQAREADLKGTYVR